MVNSLLHYSVLLRQFVFIMCLLAFAQERLDKTRDALSESKRLNHTLTERAQSLQRAQEDSELRGSELEKHNRTLKEVSQPGDTLVCKTNRIYSK